MATLKYKVIKSKTQYKEYCKLLEKLVEKNPKDKELKSEIELLALLIENYDQQNNSFNDVDPIELLHKLMDERNLKSNDLAEILNVNKSLVSEILNYKKGISKKIIRILSEYFKVSQEAFNRTYSLKNSNSSRLRNASVMNTKRSFA